jgi:hypothetical protein
LGSRKSGPECPFDRGITGSAQFITTYKVLLPFSPRHERIHLALSFVQCSFITALSLDVHSIEIKRKTKMSHTYRVNEDVLHRGQGPQGRVDVERPKSYTIVQHMPIEADGRLRYRIKSENIERVVTEDELSYCH